MTNAEAIRWLQLDIDMMKFDPFTGEDAYLNDDAKKTLEALDMAIAALGNDINVPATPATNDCISRQDAIAAIDEYDFDFPQYMERFIAELRDAMKADLKDDIKDLPSAQPEIIRCKDCYWHGTCKYEQYLGLEGYCSKAEEK